MTRLAQTGRADSVSPAVVRTLVVGADGSDDSARALNWALDVSAQRGVPVSVVTVLEEPCATGPWGIASVIADIDDESIAAARHQVRAAVRQALAARGGGDAAPEVRVEVLVAPVVQGLLEATPQDGQLVVGSRGRGGFARLLLGSVSDAVAHHATTPVTIVRGTLVTDGPVVVGVDGSDASRCALRYAAQRAVETARELVVVHAWRLFEEPWPAHEPGVVPPLSEFAAAAEQELAAFCTEVSDGPITYRLRRSRPAEALIEASADAAEIVVGARGHGGFAGLLLGSTSAQVIRHAACPVTVVPGVKTR